MKIKYYLYNTFLIETGDTKIAIDPGSLFFYYFRFSTLIPKPEWKDISHIFVTHGDIDHYWYTDKVAKISGAPVVCNKTMVRKINGKDLVLGPRDKGLAFTTHIDKLHTISVDETLMLNGVTITGIKAVHGELILKFGPFSKTVKPGPDERIGWGAIGFKIEVDGKTVVNLGDTHILADEWASIIEPDVLMIPIGGRDAHNTMNEEEALQAVKMMRPKLVIPCHYNLPALFTKKYCPADDKMFKREVEKMGMECQIMRYGSVIEI